MTVRIILTPTRPDDVQPAPYVIPAGLEHLTEALTEAYGMGVRAARAAASWTADGNTNPEHARRVLRMLDQGDPEADDHLPAEPNLSGEWADDTGLSDLYALLPEDVEPDSGAYGPDSLETTGTVLSSAWEAGRDSVWSALIEAELIQALPDQTERAGLLLDYYADDSDPYGEALDALDRLDLSDVERAQLAQAVALEYLKARGIDVSMDASGVSVVAHAGALHAWTRGAIPGLSNEGTRWQCAALAHDDVDGLRAAMDERGLVDLTIEGSPGLDVPADELSAFLSDVLSITLPVDHPAWFVNVGQFLDDDDPRRVAADRLKPARTRPQP